MILAIALLAAAASAPAPATAVKPTVDTIVARYVEARGGLAKIRSIETLRQHGHVTAGPSREALVMRELKRPNKTRFEFTLQGVTAVFASDGVRGWQVSPFRGDVGPHPLPDEVVAEAVEQGDIEGPLVDWKTKGHKVELAGTEPVDGHPAYKLKVTLKSGDVRYDYIDAKTYRLVRTDSTRQVRGQPLPIVTTFGDYKKIEGALFPGHVEVAAEGRPNHLVLTVEKVEINPTLADTRFAVPASAKP
jgi:outer membrane lipoprotein-sorting protein